MVDAIVGYDVVTTVADLNDTPDMPRPGVAADVLKQLSVSCPGIAEALTPVTEPAPVLPSASSNVPPIFAMPAPLQRGSDAFTKAVNSQALFQQSSSSVTTGVITLPGVQELCDKFKIADHFGLMLDAQLQKRRKTYEGDLETLEEVLKESKSPAALLMAKIKEMQQGCFVGMPANHRHILALQAKFTLDGQAMNKMTEALISMGKAKAQIALKQLDRHLEYSNRPSAMVMMKLPLLRRAEDLGEPTHTPAPGSLAFQRNLRQQETRRADREAGKKSSRGTHEDRSRSRDRDRGRTRGQHRHRDADRVSADNDRGRGRDRGRRRIQQEDDDGGADRGRHHHRPRLPREVREQYSRAYLDWYMMNEGAPGFGYPGYGCPDSDFRGSSDRGDSGGERNYGSFRVIAPGR